MIYIIRYHNDKLITLLNLLNKLIEKIEGYKEKNYLMADYYRVDRVLDKITKIDIEKLEDNKAWSTQMVNCQKILL